MMRVLWFLLRWLPILFTAVRAVEEFTSPDASGESKKQATMEAIESVLGKLGVHIDDGVHEVISAAVDTLVAVLHALGIFKRAAEMTEDERDEVHRSSVMPANADPELEAFISSTRR